jgi:hypothetical protein
MISDLTMQTTPKGWFDSLPDALFSLILFGLDAKDLSALACCSRHLRVWTLQEVLWQHLVLAGPSQGPVQFKVSIKLQQ